MREGIGIVSIFQIVILFLFVFVAIMCFTFNHSKAYAVKDEIITILENDSLASYNDTQKTIAYETAKSIGETINELGYRNKGTCPDGYTGYSLDGNTTSGDAYFCIRAVEVSSAYSNDAKSKCSGGQCYAVTQNYPMVMIYYDVVLFYTLDIPILTTILNLTVHGSTKLITAMS